MRVLIIKNITREEPGLFHAVLEERRVAFDVVELDRGERIPALDRYQALVVMGGPDSANDQTPKMLGELAAIRVWLATGKPYLGVCLGMQALVKAAGGQVVRCLVKEIGFLDRSGEQFTVSLTPDGWGDPLLHGLPDPFPVFELHGETVELPRAATLIGAGKFCRNQVVRVGRAAYGVQGHLELTAPLLGELAQADPDLVALGRAALEAQFARLAPEYEACGRTLFENFLALAAASHGT